MELKEAVKKRRTFAIISHPDAGKTTMTEKLLLYGGAIHLAGSVKAKKSKKFATSDWMELEKQRGISVTSSVMNFSHENHEINLIDTPGHEDFSEDTYRTLTAVDSVLMLLDAAHGVETRTRKLFEVCALRRIPTLAFINKMDRQALLPHDLLKDIEEKLGIKTYPLTWPFGSGEDFKGVWDRQKSCFWPYEKTEKTNLISQRKSFNLKDPQLKEWLGEEYWEDLLLELELGGLNEYKFQTQEYENGNLIPVLFGTALKNFAIEDILKALLDLAPSPQPALTQQRMIDPLETTFSGFIFKIQANMDPAHRDRVAFMRISSGKFQRGMKAFHVRQKKFLRLARPTQFMAQDRSLVDEAFPGDIVGIHDPGIFAIGDSFTEGETLSFEGIPFFAPEFFSKVFLKDPLKSKTLKKALDQLAQEGAVQVFRSPDRVEPIIGVLGELQLDVMAYRIQNEYGVPVQMMPAAYEAARWLQGEEELIQKFIKENSYNIFQDSRNQKVFFLDSLWRLKFYQEQYPNLHFLTTSQGGC